MIILSSTVARVTTANDEPLLVGRRGREARAGARGAPEHLTSGCVKGEEILIRCNAHATDPDEIARRRDGTISTLRVRRAPLPQELAAVWLNGGDDATGAGAAVNEGGVDEESVGIGEVEAAAVGGVPKEDASNEGVGPDAAGVEDLTRSHIQHVNVTRLLANCENFARATAVLDANDHRGLGEVDVTLFEVRIAGGQLHSAGDGPDVKVEGTCPDMRTCLGIEADDGVRAVIGRDASGASVVVLLEAEGDGVGDAVRVAGSEIDTALVLGNAGTPNRGAGIALKFGAISGRGLEAPLDFPRVDAEAEKCASEFALALGPKAIGIGKLVGGDSDVGVFVILRKGNVGSEARARKIADDRFPDDEAIAHAESPSAAGGEIVEEHEVLSRDNSGRVAGGATLGARGCALAGAVRLVGEENFPNIRAVRSGEIEGAHEAGPIAVISNVVVDGRVIADDPIDRLRAVGTDAVYVVAIEFRLGVVVLIEDVIGLVDAMGVDEGATKGAEGANSSAA